MPSDTARGTLWLHVGTHKTGTSSIQRALRLREDQLAASGVGLHRSQNAWALANTFIRASLVTTPRLVGRARPPSQVAAFDAARQSVLEMRSDLPDFIISSEEFCLMREPLEGHALIATLGKSFCCIRPVLALRNEQDWRASRANQLRKRDFWDVQKALPDARSTDGDWYYDQAGISEFWKQIGTTTVIDYDRAMADEGSILPAFSRAIEQPGLFEGLDLRLNTRSGSAR